MIINKKVEKVTGQVEFETIFEADSLMGDDTVDYTYKKYTSLSELIELLNPEYLQIIKDEDDCDRVKVSAIIFHGKGDGAQFSGHVGRGLDGFVSATIDNQDIDKRVFNNLEAIRKITENTLNGYPTAYRV